MNLGRASLILASYAAAFVAACGGGAERHPIVRVSPPSGGCLPPADARTLVVYALGDFAPAEAPAASGAIDEALAIDTFPVATRELAVELLASGSVVRAVGRSGPLDLDGLGDGAPIPILVAPLRSFCEVGSLVTARSHPIAVKAGAGVLVLGGETAGGPATTAELYDPATGAFRELASLPHFDLRGARAIATGGGRVLLVWGRSPLPADTAEGYQIYDPADESFSVAAIPPADVHLRNDAQLALLHDAQGNEQILVAGGCVPNELARDGCTATTDAQIFTPGPDTWAAAPPLAVPRAGGSAIVEGDGSVWLAGGVDGVMVPAAERRDAAGAGESVPAVGGVVAPVSAGGFVAAFSPLGVAPGVGGVAMPSSGVALGGGYPVSGTTARVGPTLTSLEDGAVLVVGGAGGGAEAELYFPHVGRFETITGSVPRPRAHHAAAPLGDGSVLIVGGSDTGGAGVLGDAWIYRHDLTGPYANLPAQVFVGPDSAPLVLPGNPDPIYAHQEADPPRLVLDRRPGIAGLSAWALLAGPRFADVDALAVVAADGAPLRLMLGADGPLAGLHITLAEDAPVSVARMGVAPAALCTGATLPDAALSEATGPHDVHAVLRAGTLTVSVDDMEVLSCPVTDAPRGAVGVGLGDGDGARLSIYALVLQR